MKNTALNSKLFINGNGPAKIFPGYKIYQHIPCGIIVCQPWDFRLFYTERQKQHLSTFPGKEHYNTLSKVDGLLNANVLDYFLKYPDRIPEMIKGFDSENNPIYTFFPNTVYQDELRGELYIRYFRMNVFKKPESQFMEINGEFGFAPHYPALQIAA